MKTKIKNLLLLLLFLALPAVVQAQNAYSTNADGSIYTYSTNADGSANIFDYEGPPWVVTIPTHINGLTVTSIGEDAFAFDNSLTSVTIPNSVTGIGRLCVLRVLRPDERDHPKQRHKHRGACVWCLHQPDEHHRGCVQPGLQQYEWSFVGQGASDTAL